MNGAAASSFAPAAGTATTIYQDPNCGCCSGWVEHMRDAGFDMTASKMTDMASVKQKLGVPPQLGSCHMGVVDAIAQIVEGHVPENAVIKLLAHASVKDVSGLGMPLNAPGMGELNGNLITVDFTGKPFFRD